MLRKSRSKGISGLYCLGLLTAAVAEWTKNSRKIGVVGLRHIQFGTAVAERKEAKWWEN